MLHTFAGAPRRRSACSATRKTLYLAEQAVLILGRESVFHPFEVGAQLVGGAAGGYFRFLSQTANSSDRVHQIPRPYACYIGSRFHTGITCTPRTTGLLRPSFGLQERRGCMSYRERVQRPPEMFSERGPADCARLKEKLRRASSLLPISGKPEERPGTMKPKLPSAKSTWGSVQVSTVWPLMR